MTGPAAEPPQPEGTARRAREWVREYLVPTNTVVALGAMLAAVVDFFSRALGELLLWAAATGLLVGAALVLGVLLRQARARGHAGAAAAPRISPRLVVACALLATVGIGSLASAVNAQQGGWLAGRFDRIALAQQRLFAIELGVQEVRRGVDAANAALARAEQPGAQCGDAFCLFLQGAPRQRFEALHARGVRLPMDGYLFARLIEQRAPARLEVLAFYLERGLLAAPDAPVPVLGTLVGEPGQREVAERLRAMWPRRLPPVEPALLWTAPGDGACPAERQESRLRLTDLAALHGDRETFDWLLARGADPRLPSRWCSEWYDPTTGRRSMVGTTLSAEQILRHAAPR